MQKGWWDIAKKHYRKVIDIDNANLQALYGVLFADIQIGDEKIVFAVDKFADKDSIAIKDLENLLKFSLNAGTKTEDKLQFINLINKFSDDILSSLKKGVVTPDITDNAYLNVIRYEDVFREWNDYNLFPWFDITCMDEEFNSMYEEFEFENYQSLTDNIKAYYAKKALKISNNNV